MPETQQLPSTGNLGLTVAGVSLGANPNAPGIVPSEQRYQAAENFTLAVGANILRSRRGECPRRGGLESPPRCLQFGRHVYLDSVSRPSRRDAGCLDAHGQREILRGLIALLTGPRCPARFGFAPRLNPLLPSAQIAVEGNCFGFRAAPRCGPYTTRGAVG